VLRHDIIKRLIEKMATFLARLAGLRADGRYDEIDGELQSIERELGLPRGHERLDARSLALLIGSADRLALASILFWHQAEVATERGRVAEAARLQLRAQALCDHVVRGNLSPTTLELLDAHPVGRTRVSGEPPPRSG